MAIKMDRRDFILLMKTPNQVLECGRSKTDEKTLCVCVCVCVCVLVT